MTSVAVITLVSAAGSPGVSTTALGLALSWPRPLVLVDADPTGGAAVLAGYLHGEVPPAGGVLELAMAQRAGGLADALPGAMVAVPDSQVRLLPGVRAHFQARHVRHLWGPLLGQLRALDGTGQDVLVDAGRLGLDGFAEPLLAGADLTLLVTRTDLPAIAAGRSWATTLREEFLTAGGLEALGSLLVGQGRPYGAGEVAAVLQIPVFGTTAWDPDSAQVFSHGRQPGRRFGSSKLSRSLRATASALTSRLAGNREPVTGPPEPAGSRAGVGGLGSDTTEVQVRRA